MAVLKIECRRWINSIDNRREIEQKTNNSLVIIRNTRYFRFRFTADLMMLQLHLVNAYVKFDAIIVKCMWNAKKMKEKQEWKINQNLFISIYHYIHSSCFMSCLYTQFENRSKSNLRWIGNNVICMRLI